MSDEQIRVLQEILEAVKEQTALTRAYRDDAMALQHSMFARQKRVVRAALVLMLVLIGFLVYTVAKLPADPAVPNGAPRPAEPGQRGGVDSTAGRPLDSAERPVQ